MHNSCKLTALPHKQINHGGSYYCRGLKSEQGAEPPGLPTTGIAEKLLNLFSHNSMKRRHGRNRYVLTIVCMGHVSYIRVGFGYGCG